MHSDHWTFARRTWFRTAACWIALHAAAASAASLEVAVVDQNGAPLADAIVYATPLSGKLPPVKPASSVVDQIKRQFVPLVSVVQSGTAITFPNKDNFEHDVYSFSPAKKFELHLYHGVPASPVVFDKPGLVVMGCNIHDSMIAYVMVVDTPWFAKTDANGHASIDNLPADNYKVTAWHYRLADANALPMQKLPSGAKASFTLNLSAQ
ncbi:plastocyanin [Paraburkholderia sp. GAS41]|jgi:plastocyanin|uniref:methylamine utilization protein n=1 Tax=Paraburkholderia sp. GAS41 TaxID=3035134 RepID=UPI003D1EF59F